MISFHCIEEEEEDDDDDISWKINHADGWWFFIIQDTNTASPHHSGSSGRDGANVLLMKLIQTGLEWLWSDGAAPAPLFFLSFWLGLSSW